MTILAKHWRQCSPDCAVNCTLPHSATTELEDLVRESLSVNTRRAYASDLRRFQEWGGQLPSSPEEIARYLADHRQTHAVASLARWLTTISKAHRAIGIGDPTRTELVRSVLRGIRRMYGQPPRQAKALLREDLFAILDGLDCGSKAIRDRALLLLGFACGFRRSELTALLVSDLEFVQQGLIVHVRRSKTDQTGSGRKIGVPFGRTRHCPVKAIENWLAHSRITEGSVFRSVNRAGEVSKQKLSAHAVSRVLKDRLQGVGFDAEGYSGHSLRSGFVTSAVQAGVSSWKIRQQTGHSSDAIMARYVRDASLFVENGSGALL